MDFVTKLLFKYFHLDTFLLPSMRPVLVGIFLPYTPLLFFWHWPDSVTDSVSNRKSDYSDFIAFYVFWKYHYCSILLGVLILHPRFRRFWWLKSRCTSVKVLAAPLCVLLDGYFYSHFFVLDVALLEGRLYWRKYSIFQNISILSQWAP